MSPASSNRATGNRGYKDPRARILSAARAVLAEEGPQGASIKRIGLAAGVSPSLIYYHFRNKEDLLLEVLRDAADRHAGELAPEESVLRTGQVSPADDPGCEEGTPSPRRYRVRYGLFALGLSRPELLPGLASLLAAGRRAANASIADVGETMDEAETKAANLLACSDGLALQKIADPSFDLGGAGRMLARMLESAVREAAGVQRVEKRNAVLRRARAGGDPRMAAQVQRRSTATGQEVDDGR